MAVERAGESKDGVTGMSERLAEMPDRNCLKIEDMRIKWSIAGCRSTLEKPDISCTIKYILTSGVAGRQAEMSK